MSATTLRPARSGRFAAVLDAGSFKTVCLIAALDHEGRAARIVGVGIAPSHGIIAGSVRDLAAAEAAIRTAIAQAENMAGIRLEQIDLLLNGGNPASRTFAAAAPINDGVVTREAIDRVAAAGRAHATAHGRQLLQLDTLGYRLDGGPMMADALGLPAGRLAAHVQAMTADAPAIANLTRTVERCYLAPRHLIPGPIASALAVTSDDERRHGVITVDIGAGVTGISVFRNARPVFMSTVPMGGGDVTLDVVHSLLTPLEEAERIKTLYGTVLNAQSDQHDVFTYALTGGGEGLEQRSTKADLARIIQSRMAHLLHLVRDQLAGAGLLEGNAARIVLCGGGSEIPGLQSFAEGVFRRPVREGRPEPVSGLPPLYASAAFAGVVGVLRAVADSTAVDLPDAHGASAPKGYIGRVGQWLRDGF
jgi:cell division protein FtsA